MTHCEHVDLGDGRHALVRMAKPRTRKCRYCINPATLLCDFEVEPGKTCDQRICGEHAQVVGENLHHCPEHRS